MLLGVCRLVSLSLGLSPTASFSMSYRSSSCRSFGLGCLILCLLAGPAASGEARFQAVVSVAGHDSAAPKVECALRATSGENTKEWALQAPWRGEIDLSRDRSWKLQIEAPGYWAQSVSLEAGVALEPVELLLLPAGIVSGKLRAPENGTLPAVLTLKMSVPPPRQGEKRSPIPTADLPCPIIDNAFHCTLPAGALDLKLQVGNYTPHYFWTAEITAGKPTDLGTLQLRSGGSLAGWVEVAGRYDANQPPAVELKPPMMGASFNPREEERQSLRAVTTKVNERGFFQLVGLAPGGYLLTASTLGFAMAEPLVVDVLAERETLLDEPIALQPMHPLVVYVEPPTGPEGAPWQVQAGKERATIPVVDILAKSPASPEGFWRSQELAPGTYRLSISDGGGSIWYEEEAQLGAAGSPLHIEIPLIPIAGRVTRAEEPLVAIVSFGTTQGRPDIRLATNEDGEFAGYLPREGEWPVELIFGEQHAIVQAVEPVQIEKPAGGEPAHVEIELPDTELVGLVVEGEARVAGAGILVLRSTEQGGRRREAMLQTGEDGGFSLSGLSEGELQLRAESFEKSSAWTIIQLQEGRKGPPVVLRLAEHVKISGQVLSPAGPVGGANVVGVPGGMSTDLAFWAQTVTAADGSFTLQVSADARWLDVIVVPAGLPVRLARVNVANKKDQPPLILQLSAQGGDLLIGQPVATPDPNVAPEPLLLSYDKATIDARALLKLLAFRRLEADEKGLTFLGLEAGHYTLCRGLGADCASGFLPSGGQLALVTPSKQKHDGKF